jgi:hypothetical protein
MISLFLTAVLAAQASPPDTLRTPSRGPAAVEVLITLTEKPAAHVFDRVKTGSSLSPDAAIAAAKAAAAAQAQTVRQQQDRVVDALRRPPYRAKLMYRLDRAANAIAVRVDGALLSQLRTLPGVKAVQVIQTDVPTGKKRSATGATLSTISSHN